MILFWILALALTGLALMFVLLPLKSFRDNPLSGDELDQDEVNVGVRRVQLEDLKSRLADGSLTKEQFQEQKDELEKQLLAELKQDSSKASSVKSNYVLPVILALLIPVLAVGLYWDLGASNKIAQKVAFDDVMTEQNPDVALEKMEAFVKDWPDDYRSRFQLAGLYMSLGRFDDAATQYDTVARKTNWEQAEPLAQAAQAVYLAAGSRITERAGKFIKQALAVDPENSTALGLSGIAAYEREDYQGAIAAWQKLLPLTRDPQARRALVDGIGQAYKAMEQQAPESVSRIEKPEELQKAEAAMESAITVQVALSPELEKLPANARVFVYARTPERPLPLAVVPLTVADLPATVELDDSTAMMDGYVLSSQKQVDIIGRISLSGDVTRAEYETRISGVQVGGKDATQLVISSDGKR